jgi:hypothetical protein
VQVEASDDYEAPITPTEQRLAEQLVNPTVRQLPHAVN